MASFDSKKMRINETILWTLNLEPVLSIRVTLIIFRIEGNMPEDRDKLNRTTRGPQTIFINFEILVVFWWNYK